jgi:hypothetical protein
MSRRMNRLAMGMQMAELRCGGSDASFDVERRSISRLLNAVTGGWHQPASRIARWEACDPSLRNSFVCLQNA